MINLLPPEEKRQIRAGQSNVLLVRYCIASLLLATLLFALATSVYLIMDNSQKEAEKIVKDSENKISQYASTQHDIAEFRSNLATAKTILDKEVHYSHIPVAIAKVLPSGVVLQSLNLDAANFGKPAEFQALGKTYDDALRLKASMEQSDIFQNVHLSSVTKTEGQSAYPISININATIKQGVAKP